MEYRITFHVMILLDPIHKSSTSCCNCPQFYQTHSSTC